MRANSFFGEAALGFHSRRTASIIANTELHLLSINASDFLQVFDIEITKRNFLLNVLRRMSEGTKEKEVINIAACFIE